MNPVRTDKRSKNSINGDSMLSSKISAGINWTSLSAIFKCILIGAMLAKSSELSAQVFDLDMNAGKTLRGEELLPRPIGRPAGFDCYSLNNIFGSTPVPHYLDWDQDGRLELDPILLCEGSSVTYDFGPDYSLSYFGRTTLNQLKDGSHLTQT
jgi:hypothetical protein